MRTNLPELTPPWNWRRELTNLLPMLRLQAFRLMGDVRRGDKVVELALEMAIAEFDERPLDRPTSSWLRELVERANEMLPHRDGAFLH